MRSNEFNQSSFLSESTVLKTGTSIYAYNAYFDREVVPVLHEWVNFYYNPVPLHEAVLSDQEVEKFFQTVGQYQVAKKLGSDLATFEPFQKDDVKELKSSMIKLNQKVAKMLTDAFNKAKKTAVDFKNMSPEDRENAVEGIKKEFEEKFQKLKKHSSKEGVGDNLKILQDKFESMFPEGWAKDPEWWREFGVKVLPIIAIMTVSVAVGMVGGPWAARFVAITLRTGLKFLQDGEIDAKSVAMGVGMGLAAGEITDLIGGVSDSVGEINVDGSVDIDAAVEPYLSDSPSIAFGFEFEDAKLQSEFDEVLEKHQITDDYNAMRKLKEIWDANLKITDTGWNLNTSIHWVHNTPLTPEEFAEMSKITGEPGFDNFRKVHQYLDDKYWIDPKVTTNATVDDPFTTDKKKKFNF